MQFFKLAFLSASALLSIGEACKCYSDDGGHNNGATHKCCDDLGGVYEGDDCKAGSISEHLSGFDSCCLGQGSDCDYPHRARSESGEFVKRAPHVEIKTVLSA
ncbi:hypothetical protein ACJ41O_009151 [Fusarium nematophilum]